MVTRWIHKRTILQIEKTNHYYYYYHYYYYTVVTREISV